MVLLTGCLSIIFGFLSISLMHIVILAAIQKRNNCLYFKKMPLVFGYPSNYIHIGCK